MSEKPQRVMAYGGAGAEQDHRDALKRDRVITGTERISPCRIPLHEGERTIPCGERTTCEIEQSRSVLVGNFCTVES